MLDRRMTVGLSDPRSKRLRGGIVFEALGIYLVLYPAFTWARRLVAESAPSAFRNAEQIIEGEQRLGIYHELTIQQWFLPYRGFIGFWNVWYGSAHFVVPLVAFVLLYRCDPGRYMRWRNTYLCMLVPILVGFWFYPLMPPRLLPSSFGFADTGLSYFTIGKPGQSGEAAQFIYSAMPSMHVAYATWVTFALWPLARRRIAAQVLLAAYPALAIFSIVVTANHYFLDAAGAWLALAIGYALASWRAWLPAFKREPSGLDELDPSRAPA